MTDHRKAVKRASRTYARYTLRQAASREVLIAAMRDAIDAGVSERQVSVLTGIDRMTVRRWLGKRTSAEQRGGSREANVGG